MTGGGHTYIFWRDTTIFEAVQAFCNTIKNGHMARFPHVGRDDTNVLAIRSQFLNIGR